MLQTGVSKHQASSALKSNNGNVTDALFSCSWGGKEAWQAKETGARVPPFLPRFLPSMCPKVSGAALANALPKVVEMYGGNTLHEHPNVNPAAVAVAVRALSQQPHRAQVVGKVAHMTHHSIPGPLRPKLAGLVTAALLWLILLPMGMKVRCVLCALLYSGMEFTFTYLERGRSYTSLAQFWGNLLYLPILLDSYGYVVGDSLFVYVACFPLNIWVLELVLGKLFEFLYGHNVAWCYLDYSDAYFNGCIRIGHGVCWIVLGIVCYYAYPILITVSGPI